MDQSFETDVGNETLIESNINILSSSFLPTNYDEIDDTLFQLVEKIKSKGISDLFKKLSANSRNCVIAYIVMFLIGAPGNLYVVVSVGWELWKRRFIRTSRIKLLIWHLGLADLFVTFVVIPIEIFWRLTIKWYGGNALCKAIQFLRTFGLYLSSLVIVCISVDRFFAIVFPLRSLGGMKRTHRMLFTAWTFSFLFASPQVIFRVEKHPLYPSFRFCTNSHFNREILYNLLSLVVMYFAPLIVIIITYALVFSTIWRKRRRQPQQSTGQLSNNRHLRQSGNVSQITRAKNKAMWTSTLIVTVFVICWTPFVVVSLWYMFDFETTERMVDPRIREALFVTALSNSCLNPIIYGSYLKRCFRYMFLCRCLEASGGHTITCTSSGTPASTEYRRAMNSSFALVVVSGRRISRNCN